ncbi:MAG: dipeptide epimerase [Alphaproteobacteria bacterium]|jgi:L-alanine-DL-glutamate epimerase-like enolase superfamily enzyme|nr:dipeptide epimerase [Alphaproteobacteria bacterium]MDP6876627.1 dipeptide epimerase [Alphaproteobacteria bacterium]
MARQLQIHEDTFPIAGSFTISRGSRTEIQVMVAEITDGAYRGRGECVPYAHYGESMASVRQQIDGMAGLITGGGSRAQLNQALAPGAARNALDCALFDLEAKTAGRRAWDLAVLAPPPDLLTAYTLSLGGPEEMAKAAHEARDRRLLKLKLGGDGDPARVAAVRQAAPDARLIVDANEAWEPEMFLSFSEALAGQGVELIEQPLPSGRDQMLADCPHPVPVCADESCHVSADLDALAGRYDLVNVKLDKCGGLTEGLILVQEARRRGFGIMVGCMLGTSLAMAPAILLAGLADYVDLDGPLLLASDRDGALVYHDSHVGPPLPGLWG